MADTDLRPDSDPFAIEFSQLDLRRYPWGLTRHRLHQGAFRDIVISAYEYRCTVCRLGHSEFLDAAHIIPDTDDRGAPVVQNGLSLCKIHHAAYVADILGISPDYEVRISRRVFEEHDGPMLRHGLQELMEHTSSLQCGWLIWDLEIRDDPKCERRHRRHRRGLRFCCGACSGPPRVGRCQAFLCPGFIFPIVRFEAGVSRRQHHGDDSGRCQLFMKKPLAMKDFHGRIRGYGSSDRGARQPQGRALP